MIVCNSSHFPGLAGGAKEGGTTYLSSLHGFSGTARCNTQWSGLHLRRGMAEGASKLNSGLSRTAWLCSCLPGKA